MVVPCDEFGNILTKPKEHLENISLYFKELDIYQKAQERVLFKGFKVEHISKNRKDLYSDSISDASGHLHLFWFSKQTKTWCLYNGLNTIENLAIFNSIELTETALKEIGLLNEESND